MTQIANVTNNSVINLALDTISIGKQALVFVNSKRSAEKTAEDLSRQIKNVVLKDLGEKILHALPKPTKQCERLSRCIKNGVAFHHAGLVHKQKELIEDEFRIGKVKIICCTPTLAAGVDLPAFRTILKDLRRYGRLGLNWIPVLEYEQQAGRAGRPSYDDHGEAICIASTKESKKEITRRYIKGSVEEIYSKLAVEPVLRTYVLSLIASGFITSRSDLIDFFSKTFYAYQFKDMDKIKKIMDKMLLLLTKFEFIMRIDEIGNADEDNVNENEFVSAHELKEDKNQYYKATLIGKRVAQLYIDPLTANYLIKHVKVDRSKNEISFLQLVSHTLELRPLLKVRNKDLDEVNNFLLKHNYYILENEPEVYDPEYDEFLSSIKTAMFFYDWINEKDEDFLLQRYNTRPGEIKVKLDIADWLLYSTEELCKLLKMHSVVKDIVKLRFRLKFGVREELLGLLRLKNIGRVRARKLHYNKIKTIDDVKKCDLSKLVGILGKKIAIDIKEQVGIKVDIGQIEIKKMKKKGQSSLMDY